KTRANIDIKPNVFARDFDNLVLMVREKQGSNAYKGVFIADSSQEGRTKIILSETGYLFSDPVNYKIQLQLRNGSIHDRSQEGKGYQILKFDRYDLTLDIPGADDMTKKQILKPREMSVAELLNRIKELDKINWPDQVAKVELSKRFSIPLTCLLFGVIGVPLGITSQRSGKSGGFIWAISIILMYYVGLVLLQNLGRAGRINPYFSVWIPNIILFVFAVYIVYKVQRESPFRILNKINDRFSEFWEKIEKRFGLHHENPGP
ncbi:MAG: LptF/LptG family permease, partial [Nitrospinaceae bacterium]|nr:YjgP/YjgQ family permease [Nitrospinaceae bacterium]NIR56085.1 YjgP/YjgQ family permease [Nitrospinaceae bacterium]NIS86533.1 YjgP/YjgQ family permease [Nitrospinaceae bacterium]NIT83367.1 YjgP/YjgQ family permease [Nitrospinaceae bacterium]NIU45577.1 YjgP/YjgQ family permease [Nitrospinaceae bacterium]